MSWIQTFTGKKVDLLDPQLNQICIEDIAHGLALINRFTGHTSVPYSVAEHSVRVSLQVPIEDRMWGLMHDASEAYLGDVTHPLKGVINGDYSKIEVHFMEVIAEKFGLDLPEPPSVKEADGILLMTEKTSLLGPEPFPWNQPYEPLPFTILPLLWNHAEKSFLWYFELYLKQVITAYVDAHKQLRNPIVDLLI